MGIFSANNAIVEELGTDIISEFQEAYVISELARQDTQTISEFCSAGGEGELMVEAGKLRKKTLVRLGKNDDLTRRETMASLVLAKKNKDPLWDKLALNRVKERELLGKIKQKYSSKATRLAKTGQQEYLKSSKMPTSFMKAGGNDR